MKSWKTIVKENNLAVSEVYFSDLKQRLDAEYYDPTFLRMDRVLDEKDIDRLGNLTEKIDVGFVGSMVSEYVDSGILLLQTRNVKEFFVDTTECQSITGQFHEKIKKSQIHKNDVLIARSGSFGNAAIYFEDEVVNSSDIIIIRSKPEIKPSYLTAFINSQYGRFQLIRFSSGGLQGHVNLTILEELKVVLPTDALQIEIEKIVYRAYAIKKESERKYAEAEELLLKEINLEGYVPSEENTSVRELTECLTDNRFDAEYWELRFDEILARIKSYSGGCSAIKDEFSQIKNGFKPDLETLYRYVEIGDINVSTGEASSTELEGKELPANAKITLEEKQLVTSKVRPNRGATAILDNHKGYIASGAFVALKETGKVTLETLQVYLKISFIRDLLLRYNTGTAYPTIVDADILNLPLPLVDRTVQEAITEKVKKCSKERAEAKELLEKAKRAVEIFIEKDEQEALEYLKK